MYYLVIKSNITNQQISFVENGIINKTSYLITLLCLYYNKSKVRGRVGPEKKIICLTIPRLQLSQAQDWIKRSSGLQKGRKWGCHVTNFKSLGC